MKQGGVLSIAAVVALCTGAWGVASRASGSAPLGNPSFRELGLEASAAQRSPPGRSGRIASASLVTDELLLELVPIDRICSVSYVVDWPGATPIAGRVPRALIRNRGEPEQLLAVRPDLVLLSDYDGVAGENALVAAGIPVLRVAAPRSFDELFAVVRHLARTLGREQRGAVLVDEWRRRLSAITAPPGAPSPRVLLLQGTHEYAAGTVQHDCLVRAGLTNVLETLGLRGTPALDAEQLVVLHPDFVFVAGDVPIPRAARPGDLGSEIRWELLPDVVRRRIQVVPSAWMASITHHALAACEAYAAVTRRRP